jgi:hypothetical protein
MNRSTRRHGPAMVIVAVLLGGVAGTSLGLVKGVGTGPTVAAQGAQGSGTVAPSHSGRSPAARAAASTPGTGGGASTQQRLSAPRRQLDGGVKAGSAGKPKQQKAPGGSAKRNHGNDQDKGKGKQAHRH